MQMLSVSNVITSLIMISTDMKGIISVIIFATTLQSLILYAESYNFTCPSPPHWKFLAKEKCNSTLKYFCLYNNVQRKYVEGCDGPDWDRKGSKRIFAGDFTRGYCIQERFQPFKFWTNASMSDCIYTKSICSEVGQIVYYQDSRKDDRTCRCDHTKNYSFITTPRNPCFCIPAKEDCSCCKKSCPLNFTLSADYKCTQNSFLGKPKCIDMNKYNESFDDTTGVKHETCLSKPCRSSNVKLRNSSIILICLCSLCTCVASGFVFAVLFQNWCAEKLELLKRYIRRRQKDVEKVNDAQKETTRVDKVDGPIKSTSCYKIQNNGNEKVDAEVHQQKELAKRKTHDDEVNFLRMIHLLFRVSCPVVRMIFNNEIKPNLLRKTLDQKKEVLKKKLYIKRVIDQGQWNLLFPRSKDSVKAKTKEIESTSTIYGTNHEFCGTTAADQNDGTLQVGKEPVEVEAHQPRELDNGTLQAGTEPFEVEAHNPKEMHNDTLKVGKEPVGKAEHKPKELEKTVSSDDFDIRLMIYLLRVLVNFDIGDLYPVHSDTRKGAMLTRIRYIRNETTQNFEGKLSNPFNELWDDIGQAVLNLVAPHIRNIEENEEMKLLIGRLITLNPIALDKHKICRYIVMSEIYPAKIIQQIISEYCTLKKQKIEDILKDEKHDLYHKRVITSSCCLCDNADISFSTYAKVIPEKQWEAMYEMIKEKDFHSCPSDIQKCSERFIPKKIDNCDLSVNLTLILNTSDILKYVIDRLCEKGFDKFLVDNKHIIYHSMEKKKCCECCKAPSEKIIIKKKEWRQLFKKEEDKLCRSSISDCCCQYIVKNGINGSNMDENLLSKLFHVAGPISVLYKIEQDAFLYFLNWTDEKQDLQRALTELLNIIEDTKFSRLMSQKLLSGDLTQSDEIIAKDVDARVWVSKHLRNQKAQTDQPYQIIVVDKDGLNVKTVQIPKDYILPNRTRHFKDLTAEENNFLVIVHALTTIVYPVIKDEFDTKCPDDELEKIRMEIYEQQYTHGSRDSRNERNKSQKKKIYLTHRQEGQLFSPKKEESRNLDLKLMIYILRRKVEEEGKKDYVDQLDVIDNIRKEIVQSSSGVLNETKFQEILKRIRKAVVHFGEELYEEKIANLQHIRNNLELR